MFWHDTHGRIGTRGETPGRIVHGVLIRAYASDAAAEPRGRDGQEKKGTVEVSGMGLAVQHQLGLLFIIFELRATKGC